MNPKLHNIKHCKTHFEGLDTILGGGFQTSSLAVIGSRPAVGKTSLMLSIAANFWNTQRLTCSYISLEEKAERVSLRLLSQWSEVELEKITASQQEQCLDGDEFQRIIGATNELQESRLYISSIFQDGNIVLKAVEKAAKEEHSNVIFVDYLQLLAYPAENVHDTLTPMLIDLKRLAMEYDVCIIASSQLTRKVCERQGNRPVLHDLRDSGSIEEIADQILFLHRRDYYDPNDKPGMAELIVAKNRLGQTGSCTLTFRKEIGQFCDYKPIRYNAPQMAEY